MFLSGFISVVLDFNGFNHSWDGKKRFPRHQWCFSSLKLMVSADPDMYDVIRPWQRLCHSSLKLMSFDILDIDDCNRLWHWCCRSFWTLYWSKLSLTWMKLVLLYNYCVIFLEIYVVCCSDCNHLWHWCCRSFLTLLWWMWISPLFGTKRAGANVTRGTGNCSPRRGLSNQRTRMEWRQHGPGTEAVERGACWRDGCEILSGFCRCQASCMPEEQLQKSRSQKQNMGRRSPF